MVSVETTSVTVIVVDEVAVGTTSLLGGFAVLVTVPVSSAVVGTVTVLVCVRVQGQSVMVKVVASVTAYVAPFVVKVVGLGQYVVNSVTTSVEVT